MFYYSELYNTANLSFEIIPILLMTARIVGTTKGSKKESVNQRQIDNTKI